MSFALNAIYNNYLSAYTPKSVTQYDTHKKSELRSVYNSIVKINKDAPWYLPTTNKETQAYAVDLKENARDLHNTLAQLGGLSEEGLFNKKRAYSSDSDVISATYVGESGSDVEAPDIEVEVTSLASGQENLGYFLDNDKIGLAAGSYSFDVAINDMNYEFQFAIGESETNRDVQDRLVRLIRNSGIGLSAELAESDGKTALKLTSDASGLPAGKDSIFMVSDDHTSKTAGTVAYFGIDYTSHTASNASFLLNGEERTASSNHFTIGKVYEVELKGLSEEGKPAQIGLKTDTESFADNIIQLANGFNDFYRTAASYVDKQSKSKQLVSELKAIAQNYENSLEPLGLSMNEDGTLQVNREVLQQNVSDAEDLSSTFGALKTFSNSLLRESNQVSINPMKYVQKTVVAYKNPGHSFVSPYTTSAYSGMMFNGYC